eukprot:1154749-Pelagomonas_calceolata.AAC.1
MEKKGSYPFPLRSPWNAHTGAHKPYHDTIYEHDTNTKKLKPTPKNQCRRGITYTDGSDMKTKDDPPPPLVSSGVYKPNKEGDHPSPQLQLQLHSTVVYIKPNGHG